MFAKRDWVLAVLGVAFIVAGDLLQRGWIPVGWTVSLTGLALLILQIGLLHEIRGKVRLVDDFVSIKDSFARQIIVDQVDVVRELVRQVPTDRLQLSLHAVGRAYEMLAARCSSRDHYIRGLDIDSERWARTTRYARYHKACIAAAKRGARVERVFVLSNDMEADLQMLARPGLSFAWPERCMALVEVLCDHWNHGMIAHVVFDRQCGPLGRGHDDFALFCTELGERLLLEHYDGALGNSQDVGEYSSAPATVASFAVRFERLLDLAKSNDALLGAVRDVLAERELVPA